MKRVSPAEAQALLAEGYVYVDVRSEVEFEGAHPAGAYNIPLQHRGPMGARMNDDLLEVFQRRFPPGTRMVIGCATGNRSVHVCQMLERAGWSDLVELRTGIAGARDMMGRVLEAGWADAGLPIESGQPEGRSWAALEKP